MTESNFSTTSPHPTEAAAPSTTKPVNPPHRETGEAILLTACREGRLFPLAEQYVTACRAALQKNESDGKGKLSPRFPNLAGFCRYLHCGMDTLEAIREETPAEYAKLQAILEDEALNFVYSPTLLTAYLKRRLDYEKDRRESDRGALQICFEHDILEDGE